jgi:hypothetical protein
MAAQNGHLQVVEALINDGADASLRGAGISPMYLAAKNGLLRYYPLLPPELTSHSADLKAVLAFLRAKWGDCRKTKKTRSVQDKKRRARRRQERKQEAGRGDGLDPLLDKIAKLST